MLSTLIVGGDLDVQLVLRRGGVAGGDAIERVLLKTAAARRQFATIVIGVVGAGHGDAVVTTWPSAVLTKRITSSPSRRPVTCAGSWRRR